MNRRGQTTMAEKAVDMPETVPPAISRASRLATPLLPRLLAAPLCVGAFGYGVGQLWTAIGLSAGAPLLWRLRLLLLEGGVPMLVALALVLAALGGPRLRRAGWIAVGAILLACWVWVGHVVAVPDVHP